MATRGWEHATLNDVRDRRAPTKRAKYGAVPTTVDGIRFHSAKEAARYGELKLLEKAGAIHDLALQPRFALSVNGIRLGDYVGDFRYYDVSPTGHSRLVVEDVKGMRTLPLATWKQKHVFAQYGIQIREVR